MGYGQIDNEAKVPSSWWCDFCEKQNRWQDYECRDCERPRYYQLTQRQARALARELQALEAKLDIAQDIANTERRAAILYWERLGKLRQKQPCGHERRFIVEGLTNFMDEQGVTRWGMGWCALCVAESKYKTEGSDAGGNTL